MSTLKKTKILNEYEESKTREGNNKYMKKTTDVSLYEIISFAKTRIVFFVELELDIKVLKVEWVCVFIGKISKYAIENFLTFIFSFVFVNDVYIYIVVYMCWWVEKTEEKKNAQP
jgi:fatty acid desaturase